jgi:hypothetical protein
MSMHDCVSSLAVEGQLPCKAMFGCVANGQHSRCREAITGVVRDWEFEHGPLKDWIGGRSDDKDDLGFLRAFRYWEGVPG